MRILFLADAVFSDLAGGSRVVARETALQLAASGHEVTFLVARHNDHAPSDETPCRGIRIVRYPGAGNPQEFVRNGQQRCAALLSEGAFDIVHTHFAYAAIGPLRVIPKSVPRVRTFHGPWDEEFWFETTHSSRSALALAKDWLKANVCRAVESANLTQSSRVVTLSRCFADKVTNKYRYPESRVHVVPGGVDSDRFRPGDKQTARANLGLPKDRRILITIRRLTKRMGIDNLLTALPALVKRYPDLLLLIGGKGPEQSYLEGIIDDLRLSNHVRFLGYVADQNLPDYYRAADLFVLPTISLEGFGLVTIEALASGLPVVATPAGATPEILGDLEPRLIAAGHSPADLTAVILEFFEGGWSKTLTVERLKKYSLDRYTWGKHARAVEGIYYSLVPSPPDIQSTALPSGYIGM